MLLLAKKSGSNLNGGEKGIRTLETRKGLHDFESCAFNRSAISPLPRGRVYHSIYANTNYCYFSDDYNQENSKVGAYHL